MVALRAGQPKLCGFGCAPFGARSTYVRGRGAAAQARSHCSSGGACRRRASKVEAGEALTADVLNTIYADVFSAYYGDAVHADKLNDIEWSRIPHFLRGDNFYVYQYSTSFVAATALAKQILEEGEPARERFLTMLKSGSNDYPIELLKKAGIDMTTAQPVVDTVAVFADYVDQLEQALRDMER